MRLAFLSDIHGNIHALTAVKRFLKFHAPDQVIVVGDLVGYGASPGPVIDFVQHEEWTVCLGSSDARVALDLGEIDAKSGVGAQALAWTRTVLTPAQMDYLRGLPTGGRMMTPLGRVRYFHGSPYSPDERMDLMAPEAKLAEIAEQLRCTLIVAAGTHVPFTRAVGETLFVDPGSVGLTLNGEPGADVVIVEMNGAQPQAQLHKVPYDVTSAVFDIKAWELPETIVQVLQTGRIG